MGTVNLAAKYSPKIDERFSRESITENIGFNKDYDWNGVDTVTVYDVPTVELTPYTRSGTSRYGELVELEDTKTDYKVEEDKSFTYSIDEGNSKSQMDIKMKEGASLGRQVKEVIIPTLDKYRLKVMSDNAIAEAQYVDGTQLTKTNAYEKFLAMNEDLDEANAPVNGRITFVNPTYYNLLKQDNAFIKNSEIGSKQVINGQIGEVDGNRIIKAPSTYFENGVVAITIYPKCMTAPMKLKRYVKHTNPMGVDGMVVEGRIMHDAFILKSKNKAVSVLLSTLPST